MKMRKNGKCLLLVALMLLTCIGCTPKTPTNNPSGDSQIVTSDLREPAKVEEEVVYEDNDHLFDYKSEKWDGPKGYVIVVPKGDANARETAKVLVDYYKESLNITLSIVTDNNKEKDKEILIGKTNRKQSNKDIAEADIEVSIKEKKLVFDGGHYVTVDTAVNRFVRLAPKEGEAFTFKNTTNFKSEMTGDFEGYKYVWGNEFEGLGLQSSDFDSVHQMDGSDIVVLSVDKDVIDVNDGRMKMHAIPYFDNNSEVTRYKIPVVSSTINHMNYVYGYAELRARVPYASGVFPAWWTRNEGRLAGDPHNEDYMLEIDIYEIFRTYEKTPNMIQWFTPEFDYNSRYEPDATPGVQVQIPTYWVGDNPYVYKMKPSPSLNYEYHLYGYEWTPTYIKMYVDGECHVTYDITKNEYTKHPDMSGFHKPQYFNLNTHLFHPTISTASQSIDLTPENVPACHYVDYIRLYQKDGVGKVYTAD